jgi:hypothetical protein
MTAKALEGLWFHSKTEDGKIKWQGQVLEHIGSDNYLVQLYDWMLGQSSCIKMQSLYMMEDWDFYNTSEEMKEANGDRPNE